MKKLIKLILSIPSKIYHYALFKTQRVSIGNNIRVYGRLYIKNKGKTIIGSNCIINSSPTSNPIGCGVRTFFQVLGNANLTIGNGARISNCAITCGEKITIGNNVFIGAGVKIYDTDFHSINPIERTKKIQNLDFIKTKPIVISDYAFIGAGSYILKGSCIGFSSVIGAGSVVCSDVPEKQIWAGNPAKFIRNLTESELNSLAE